MKVSVNIYPAKKYLNPQRRDSMLNLVNIQVKLENNHCVMVDNSLTVD